MTDTANKHKPDEFARLRELLGAQPSRKHFEQVFVWCRDWEEQDTQEIALDYAIQHLREWPDEYRATKPDQSWPEITTDTDLSYLQLAKTLDLSDSNLTREGITLLVSSPHAAQLTALYLNNNRIGVEGAQALANSPYTANIRSLNLYNNHLGDEGTKAIVGSPYMTRLRTLYLYNNGIGDEGAEAIARAESMAGVQYLYLNTNKIGPAGATALAASPHLAQLSQLYLNGNPIGQQGDIALGLSRHLPPRLCENFLMGWDSWWLYKAAEDRAISLPRDLDKSELIRQLRQAVLA